jgi:glutaconyl-CoA/methylmalonyl-CoA decarboxylase subunit gamma
MNLQVKIGDQIFCVEVDDLSARPILAKVDGDVFEVWPEERESLALPAVETVSVVQPVPARAAPAAPRPVAVGVTAAPITNGSMGRTVAAPIPGVIVSIEVKSGDNVTVGQELCGLEAMKMKNSIRSNRNGTIAAILVNVGDHVQKGHALVEYAD